MKYDTKDIWNLNPMKKLTFLHFMQLFIKLNIFLTTGIKQAHANHLFDMLYFKQRGHNMGETHYQQQHCSLRRHSCST
jgi:hypothetical protein